MLGFAWLTIRQAQEALRNGRPEEAQRLLGQPCTQGHKRSWELLQQTAQAFIERGERNLQQNNIEASWNDLVAAEQVGAKDNVAANFRQVLTRLGLLHVRSLLVAGEPAKALEVIGQLHNRGVQQPELQPLEEAARAWSQAKDQASRGDFAVAIQTAERARNIAGERVENLEAYIQLLEKNHQSFSQQIVDLHEAAYRKDWREAVRLSEQVLGIAPQHMEARKARAKAWRAIDPETVSSVPRPSESLPKDAPAQPRGERLLLWIDGVGGFLVCMASRVSLGQATPDAFVDIPLFADVSRIHATIARETEGYLLEATRPLQVNGRTVEKALLQSNDRITLGSSCQIQFRQPAPVSTSARLDLVSGHRLPLSVDGVLLMADTLILGSSQQAHVIIPDLQNPVVLYRHKDGLGVRCGGNFSVDGQKCRERGILTSTSSVQGDDFAFAIEPVGTGMGRM